MKDIVNKVVIKADREKVWDLLTNPDLTPEYMYTCAILSNFKKGSSVIWKGIHDDVIYVTGKLIAFKPYSVMSYTVIDPNADYPQTPENHLKVQYLLEEKNDKTLLTVIQSGYETVAEGQKRYDEAIANGGWTSILEKIKEMAEAKS
ncbi:SRPBCC domain-containing protein [Portibacter marinus]|uniref:SRPBCC domain-containing protein n=1 Tax=Portibacter marinus TaxID=2898660 RepID=UPI001F17923C|nr:SRPBCC domain-containing protein [Portibacter marinus]